MLHFDAAILNLTERFCRRFQRLTGRTNVWLAAQLTNLSIIVYFVWAGMYFVTSDAFIRIVLGVFCGGLLYVLTQTVLRVPIEAHENEAYRRVARGARNPRRLRDALLRIPFLTLSVALFYPILLVYINLRSPLAILSYSLIVLTTIVLYLLACDPLPPCTGKVKEWLSGAASSRVAPAESTEGNRARASRGDASRLGGRLARCPAAEYVRLPQPPPSHGVFLERFGLDGAWSRPSLGSRPSLPLPC